MNRSHHLTTFEGKINVRRKLSRSTRRRYSRRRSRAAPSIWVTAQSAESIERRGRGSSPHGPVFRSSAWRVRRRFDKWSPSEDRAHAVRRRAARRVGAGNRGCARGVGRSAGYAVTLSRRNHTSAWTTAARSPARTHEPSVETRDRSSYRHALHRDQQITSLKELSGQPSLRLVGTSSTGILNRGALARG